MLKKNMFDLVITDQVMNELDGIQVLKNVKELNPETQVIIFTGYNTFSTPVDALRLHADEFLLKPCESKELIRIVKRCLENLVSSRKIKLMEIVDSIFIPNFNPSCIRIIRNSLLAFLSLLNINLELIQHNIRIFATSYF